MEEIVKKFPDIILDTNIIIHFIKGETRGEVLVQYLQNQQVCFGISSVTEMELYLKPELTEDEKIKIEECLQYFSIIDVNSYIAKIAAYYRKDYHIPYVDVFIAATAKYLDIPLWTYNLKDFKQIPNLTVTQPQLNTQLSSSV
ncbi:MAG: PIN domain-containing protein [Patescibacteria group bacterium]|jgi:hypothetical protein